MPVENLTKPKPETAKTVELTERIGNAAGGRQTRVDSTAGANGDTT